MAMNQEQSSSQEVDYKKYTTQARTCIRGEAFFELLISEYAIPHHIAGAKDLGIDYICEWSHGDRPSGILFAVQVKAFRAESVKITLTESRHRLNELTEHRIENPNLRIDDKTAAYWRGFGVPAFLFAIAVSDDLSEMQCFYRRYTEDLTSNRPMADVKRYDSFFRCSCGTSFSAFADPKAGKGGGFARDLFIDHVRCAYSKGMITFPDPRSMGLNQFSKNSFFSADLYREYKDQLHETYERYQRHLAHRIR